jgi:nucleoid-associated protein YgaU
MITASKAFIALCGLAVAGTAAVIGPVELRRLLPGMSTNQVSSIQAATSAAPEAKPEPLIAGMAEVKAEPKIETKAETGSAGATKLASASDMPAVVAPSAVNPSQTTAALTDPASKASPAAEPAGPRFDVARIDPDGVAVVAGQSTPGSKVELLRNGEPIDTAVADSSGQFVMTPSKLPRGEYELTLRAKAPDGTVTQSSRGVAVALNDIASPPQLAAAPRVAAVHQPAEIRTRSANAAASATTTDAPTGSVAIPNRIVSRGDSLWAISRRAYGDGARYDLIFSANRDKIHNPDLIYPGQTFVLPRR